MTRMDVIDGKWISARLTGRHGEKTELADAMGTPIRSIVDCRAPVDTDKPYVFGAMGSGVLIDGLTTLEWLNSAEMSGS